MGVAFIYQGVDAQDKCTLLLLLSTATALDLSLASESETSVGNWTLLSLNRDGLSRLGSSAS